MKSRVKQTVKKQKEMRELKPYFLIYKWMKDNLTNRQQRILQFLILHLESGYQLSAKELSRWFWVSTAGIYREMKVFREKNILIKDEKEGGEIITFEKVLPCTRGVI